MAELKMTFSPCFVDMSSLSEEEKEEEQQEEKEGKEGKEEQEEQEEKEPVEKRSEQLSERGGGSSHQNLVPIPKKKKKKNRFILYVSGLFMNRGKVLLTDTGFPNSDQRALLHSSRLASTHMYIYIAKLVCIKDF